MIVCGTGLLDGRRVLDSNSSKSQNGRSWVRFPLAPHGAIAQLVEQPPPVQVMAVGLAAITCIRSRIICDKLCRISWDADSL